MVVTIKVLCKLCLIFVFISVFVSLTQAQPKSKKASSKKTTAAQTAVNKPTDEEFILAMQASDWKLVRKMILQGANVNSIAESTLWRPVHHAAYGQQLEILNMLLQRGADANATETSGDSALHVAIFGCECKTILQQTLLNKIIAALAKSEANFNLENKDGETPLVTAAQQKEGSFGVSLVKTFIANGANVNYTNQYDENIAQILTDGEKKNAAAQFILAQSKPAAGQGLGKPTDEGFMRAANSGNWKRVLRMINTGANPNAVDNDFSDNTALHYATKNKEIDVVNALLKKGANVNAANEYGETPLNNALNPLDQVVDINLVKTLMGAGAKVNTQSKDGLTPLMQAVGNSDIDISIIKLLLEKGANPNLTNKENETALDMAIYEERKDVVELLKPLVKKTDDKRANLPGKFFNNGGVEIYYEVRGAKTGTPLFVVHGGPGFDHQYFLTNNAFETIAKNRPVIFYDQRGTGFSTKLTKSQTSTVKDQIEDLLALQKHLGYEKIDVMGHSWGGFVAMLYARLFPEKISHLILCDTVAPDYQNEYSTFESEYPELFDEMKKKRMEGSFNKDPKAMRASLVAYMSMLFHSPQKRDTFIASSGNFTYNADINSRLNKDAESMDLTKELKSITTPTLILHGKYDANITPDVAERIQNKIPKSQLVIFTESGHLPFYEEPEKFISVVEDFLNGKKVSGK